ncbi:MAG: DUF1800 domain-containing protein [Chloroflexi bacterium]|nr:DUF1800 domain-containing protein [Chloroflexota bacterium]
MNQLTNRRKFLQQLTGKYNKPDKPAATTAVRQTTLTAEQDASRFLAQATLGADLSLIQQVTATGIEAWIDQQLALPQSQILDYLYANLYDPALIGSDESPRQPLFRYALWDMLMTGSDLLRQRVALALSEIMVIATEKDDISNAANGAAHWYDMLLQHAFGNFRDLLQDVTLHPLMGNYLSHAGNRKADPALNRFPDENYAREVMQLFTIGLFLLNDDGSFILDGDDEPIPTYDNDHITEFAKIFTGLQYDVDGDPYVWWPPDFETGWLNPYTAVRPMVMWEEEHEPGPKYLLNGVVIPSGQTGMQDINDALDHLFNHANVGPFIGRRLIQRLVKSNPSADYIGRVTAVFDDNGSGIRGDMKAVVKAILLDDEARNPSHISDPHNGKLREPFFRFAQLLRAFNYNNPQNKYWDAGWSVDTELQQFIFNPPTVFNFFLPDYRPPGPLSGAGLTGPEFQLQNSYTAISTINFWYSRLDWDYVFDLPDSTEIIHGQTHVIDQPKPDLTYEMTLLNDIPALIDHLDLLLTYGTLSAAMRGIIETAVTNYAAANPTEQNRIVQFAIFLFMLCPEYAIQV